jgi:hypothetical protein
VACTGQLRRRINILAISVRLFTDMFLPSAQYGTTVRSLKPLRRRQAHSTCRASTAMGIYANNCAEQGENVLAGHGLVVGTLKC